MFKLLQSAISLVVSINNKEIATAIFVKEPSSKVFAVVIIEIVGIILFEPVCNAYRVCRK